jgi:hypothetical protein
VLESAVQPGKTIVHGPPQAIQLGLEATELGVGASQPPVGFVLSPEQIVE